MSIVLLIHIIGGSVGLFSGIVALATRKGGKVHRMSGKVFVISMLITTGVGAYIAVIKSIMITVIAGIFTFYIIASSLMTVLRKPGKIGMYETVSFIVVALVAVSALLFGLEAQASETGLKDGYSAEAYFFFAIMAFLAAFQDLSVLIRKGLVGAQRIARHLWRMCFGMFIATGSFFAQATIFPQAVQDSGLLSVPENLVILLMVFWLGKVLLGKRFKIKKTVAAE